MIKAVLIDDEKKAVKNLTLLIDEFCENVEVVGSANSVNEGVKVIESHKPDLVFLDIEMPFGTGFDLLSQLENVDFEVIFVTAYNQYAIKAIKNNALDYILKPVGVEELRQAISKVEVKRDSFVKGSVDGRLESLLESMNSKTALPVKLALPCDGGYEMVLIDSIVRCEASINYTIIYFEKGKKVTASKTLKFFEDLLPEGNFFRVHQSHLVNLDKVDKYFKSENSYLHMCDSSNVPISRRKKVEVDNYFLKK